MSFCRFRNQVLLAVLLLNIILLTNIAHADMTGSYMSRQPTWIGYLRLTQTNSKVTGYFQYVYADSRNITQIRRSDLHGTVSGNTIAVKLDSFLGYGGKDAGGIKRGGKVILEFPTTNGRVETYTFSTVTTQAWNQAVTVFQRHWALAISLERTRSATMTRQKWLDEQDTIITLAIFNSQEKLAGRLDELAKFRGVLKKWQDESMTRQNIYEKAKAIADKATKEASNSDERFRASELQFQAADAKFKLSDIEFNMKNAKIDISNILNDIEQDKIAIKENVRQIRTLQLEMKQNNMQYPEAPELGKFIAIVKSTSAKIRASRDQNSKILREVREGAYLGVIATHHENAFIILPNGQNGTADLADLRLINLESTGRQKVGQLGIVTVLDASITKEHDENSEVVMTAKRDSNLCILREQGDYYEVELQNGSRGWVKRINVRLLNYEITRDEEGKLYAPGLRN